MGPKSYTTKNHFVCSITFPYGPGNFPIKAKNRKTGGAGFRQPQPPQNMVSRGPYGLLRHHKKVKRNTLYLTTATETGLLYMQKKARIVATALKRNLNVIITLFFVSCRKV